MMTVDQLEALMVSNEDENLEFKEAKTGFHFDKLAQYCAALANQGGGHIILGVTDRRPRRVIESPGGFPPGINSQNILDRQAPRNRRVADIFAKCGLVERSGQGMNLMFELSIQEGKSIPDFTGTDGYQVTLTLNGEVQDVRFLQFLEKVGRERLELFGTEDFLLLDLIHRGQPMPDHLKPRLNRLVSMGIIERYGKGRGVRYVLCRRFYKMTGEKGIYTRKKGLDRGTNKALLLRHIEENKDSGSQLSELMQVLPALSRPQVQTLLRELKSEERIYKRGTTRAALWFPGPDGIASGKED